MEVTQCACACERKTPSSFQHAAVGDYISFLVLCSPSPNWEWLGLSVQVPCSETRYLKQYKEYLIELLSPEYCILLPP